MTKGNDGVWTLTTDPLEPDYYAYTFIADGVSLLDPMNAVIRPNLLNPQSVLHVSGFRPEAATSERSAADRRLELALGTDAPAFS